MKAIIVVKHLENLQQDKQLQRSSLVSPHEGDKEQHLDAIIPLNASQKQCHS